MLATLPIIAVTGLAFEARIAAGPGVICICSGDRRRFADDLRNAVTAGCRGVISFGIAGGLSSHLKAGAWIVASDVIAGDERLAADPDWSQVILKSHPTAIMGSIAGVDHVVDAPAAKRMLGQRTGAIAVDMESHVAARTAAEHGVPFAAVRVVADPAHRRLPKAALNAVRADGTPDIRAVLRSLARNPRQLPDLTMVAFDTRRARAALLGGRRLLGARFGLPELVLA